MIEGEDTAYASNCESSNIGLPCTGPTKGNRLPPLPGTAPILVDSRQRKLFKTKQVARCAVLHRLALLQG